MKYILKLFCISIFILSCKTSPEVSSVNPVNWERRVVEIDLTESLLEGRTYLSVYSQIYSQSEQRTHDLTATISMRNVNLDTIYIKKAEYFDTKGNSIRSYFDKTIFIAPMETVEIIIDERDRQGGTGANFIFDWMTPETSQEPYFEGVMISTSGQQGLSFTTQGLRIN